MRAPRTTPSTSTLEMPPGGTILKPATNGDPIAGLRSPAIGSTILRVKKRHAIFQQATPADAVFYLLKGRVKLTAVSPEGREATIAILQPGDFLGEESLDLRERPRTTTAIALSECTVLKTERQAMLQTLERDPQLFRFFLSFLIARDVRMQEDLLDRLLHSSEQRLARVLLLLAGLSDLDQEEAEIPKVSQEILAEIVGTTRSRVSVFMNKFRERGLIDYDGEYSGKLRIRSALKDLLAKR
jgi:CRP-like cAMP-binding protein